MEDVQFANANRDSPLPLKGARNYTDLIRITGNIAHLISALAEMGHSLPAQKSKQVWAVGEVPPEAEIDKIRQDMASLREAAVIHPSTPAAPGLPYTHYEKMNDIERILYDIHMMEQRRKEGFVYSGEMYSGEEFFDGFSI